MPVPNAPANHLLKRSCQNGILFISFMKQQLCRAFLIVAAFYGGLSSLHSQTPPPREMNLIVVEGEGQTMNIGEHARKPPMVRVEDENHKPIVGAAVIFTLPTEGATGDFGGGSKTLTVMTDGQGQAAAKGLRVNLVPGKLPIYVNASYRGLTQKVTITEFVAAIPGAKVGGGGHSSGKIIAILAIVGAAAAGGAYYATHSGGSSTTVTPPPTPPAPIGITPGTGTIGGAH